MSATGTHGKGLLVGVGARAPGCETAALPDGRPATVETVLAIPLASVFKDTPKAMAYRRPLRFFMSISSTAAPPATATTGTHGNGFGAAA